MRFNWRFLLAGFVAICGFSACEEDFDPNADYQETAIIYSFLDSSQPVQYVKVTKAFLNTNTNALYIAANEPDSSRLDSSKVTVILNRISPTSDSSILASYTLQQKPVLDKEDGAFSTAEQYVFASDSNQISLQDNELYQVVVTNKLTGKQYTSATRVVKKICIHQVGYNAIQNACTANLPSQALAPHRFQNLRFDVVPNAEIYKASYFLIYKEFKNGSEDLDTVEFIPVNNSFITAPPLTYTAVIDRDRMFQELANKIDISGDDNSTYRTMEPSFVKVTAGGIELARFVEVNNAYSAILQSRPEYTNIKNGTGLFSSRNTQIVPVHFDQTGVDSLQAKHPQLKFAD